MTAMTRSTLMTCLLIAAAAPNAPRETGRVRFGADLDAALARSAQNGRPVLLLFQEIPGCQTCVDFGQSPLSHPLLVEAIEDEFVPVLVHNNRAGRDADLLTRFNEPAWNNPVMRFLDANAGDLLPRRDGIWRTGQVARRLIEALEAARREAPEYLVLAAAESGPGRPATATFAMHCFWEGEAKLGAVPGVLTTRARWLGGREVVEVAYDEAILGKDDLLQRAKRLGYAPILDDPARARDAPPEDQKHALNASPMRYLLLTPMQATWVNAELAEGGDPARWLSPRQKSMLAEIEGALRRDAEALRGLERPAMLDQLPAYQDRLAERLGPLAGQEAPHGRP